MNKILFMITKSENGGAQKWTKEQMQITSGHFEVYLSTDEAGWLVKNTAAAGYLIDFGIRKRFSLRYLIKLIKFVRKNKINLIVASSANAGIYSRIAKLFTKVRIIYVGHGWSSIYSGGKLKFFYVGIEKALSLMTDSVLCISDSDYSRAKDEIGISEKKLKILKNSILPMKKKSLEIKDDRLRILSVARLAHPKRMDLLISSMEFIDANLYIVGDGPLRAGLEELTNDKIHFLGEISGFDEFYKYDVFVLISDSEGLPISALEAMSAGLPLVLSNVGGCPELIAENGILVENRIDDIISGIQNTIDMKDIFSSNSLRVFDQKYNLLTRKEAYLEYYANTVARSD